MAKKQLARVLIRPPSRPSNGAQTIRRSLGNIARLSRVLPIPRQYRTVVNWGNPHDANTSCVVLNKPEAVRRAMNKIAAFDAMKAGEVSIPLYTQSKNEVDLSKNIWLARTVLDGSSGRGIVVLRYGNEIPDAPLYVQYVRKVEEYRAHVAFGKVIFVQQKRRRSDAEQTADEKLIRSYDNGWVFCPIEFGDKEAITAQAVKAVAALGLDFGAVDIIVSKKGEVYVLEVNTAPGLESPGLIDAYTQAFKEKLQEGGIDTSG